MEVNTNLSTIGLSGPIPAKPPAAAAPSPSNRVDSPSLSSLDDALQNLPDSRSEAVNLARNLLASPHYPPLAVINSISRLIAGQLSSQPTSQPTSQKP